MAVVASPWHPAHDLAPAGASFHNASPSSTASMPGLARSSSCIAWVSRLMKTVPERRSFCGISAAKRIVIAELKRRTITTLASATTRRACLNAVMAGTRPSMTGKCVNPRLSFHRYICFLRHRLPVVGRPGQLDDAALAGEREEGDERVGGDGGVEIGAEHLLAVIAGDESVDDVARNGRAVGVVAVAGLHRVRDQRLDLDHLAALGLRRHVDESLGHGDSSRQAASVTIMSALADQNEPSLSSAIATTF